jgi:peptidyl-prolyl cis-trans isomerase B (cyclophilin B)
MSSIRTYALWVLPCAVLVLAVLFLADNSYGFFENARHRTFNKQEIQKMKQTTATIETKFGEITLKFFPEAAPNHVNSFIELAKDGFFDGTTFHRVVPGFVIQGGDPNTKSDDRSRHGMGGPGFTLKAEFSNLPHKRGTLSMARAGHPDSAGSQFFICVADAPFLDGEYTVFGEVVEGMDVVDKIVSQPKDQRDNPVDRVEMKVKIEEPEDKS